MFNVNMYVLTYVTSSITMTILNACLVSSTTFPNMLCFFYCSTVNNSQGSCLPKFWSASGELVGTILHSYSMSGYT